MNPELQLMRWLKCMLAREFSEFYSLQCWDFILGGMFFAVTNKFQDKVYLNQGKQPFNFKEVLSNYPGPIPDSREDPLINLDVLCASLIIIKKDQLLQSDFSSCLSSLWKYELKNPDDPTDLIVRAI